MNPASITVNGETRRLDVEHLAALLARLGYGDDPRGVAVARNGRVVPRSAWSAETLSAGDVVEIVGAVQGG